MRRTARPLAGLVAAGIAVLAVALPASAGGSTPDDPVFEQGLQWSLQRIGAPGAWARATGEVSVPNYEIDAAGRGMWRIDQRALTQPYAEAYFADLDAIVAAHQGWVQGTVVTAYFPITHLDAATVAAGQAALGTELPGAVRRRLADAVDELQRRVAVLG